MMSNLKDGRVPSEPGSREPSQQAVSAASGFDPSRTCGSCAFIGSIYWGYDPDRIHHCGKSDLRRRDNFRSCGDFAEDFMSEFRKFYDATAKQRACRHYAERPTLNPYLLGLLRQVGETGEEGFVAKFFSPENSALSPLRDRFVTSDFAFTRAPARGERRYWLTELGRVEIARDSDRSGEADETAKQAQPEARARAGTASHNPSHQDTPPNEE